MADDENLTLLAELSVRVDNAQRDFQRVADEAFDRLKVIDPDLAVAVQNLFGLRQKAVSWLATARLGDYSNAYAVLAAGNRDLILETMTRVEYGIF